MSVIATWILIASMATYFKAMRMAEAKLHPVKMPKKKGWMFWK